TYDQSHVLVDPSTGCPQVCIGAEAVPCVRRRGHIKTESGAIRSRPVAAGAPILHVLVVRARILKADAAGIVAQCQPCRRIVGAISSAGPNTATCRTV